MVSGSPCERLADEGGHHAAILEPHARAVGVEDADDLRVDLVIAMIGHGHRLGETLGFVVDAARPDGIDVAPVFLGLRMDERVAVAFGGGGEQEPRALCLGQAERVVRAERTDLERLDRQLEIIDRAGRRGEVENIVHRAGEIDELRHIMLDELKSRVAREMRDIIGIARDEVVDGDDAVALGEEAVGKMGAEKAGAAGDNGHRGG